MRSGTTDIAIVGAGAIGTVIAWAAAEVGHRVTLCARRPIDEPTIVRGGVTSRVRVHLASDPATVAPVEWVLLATKAHQTAGAAAWLSALCVPHTRVVVCQNGIDHVRRVGPVAALEIAPAIVGIIAETVEPGVVVHRGGNQLTLADGPVGVALSAAFADSPLKIQLVDDLERASWCKLLGNLAAAPVTTLLQQPMSVMRSPGLQTVLRAVLTEAVQVGRACGVALDLSDVDNTLALLASLPDEVRSSMEVDWAHGRPLEIEEITGALVDCADRHGVDVSVNRTLLALVRELTIEGRPSCPM